MREGEALVAHRFVTAQTWGVISQLVARNSRLRLHQQVDFIDGESLVLELTDSPTIPLEVRNRMRVVFDRAGVTVILPTQTGTMLWGKALTAPNSIDIVRGIETGLGLTPITGRPRYKIKDRALAYTMLGLLLAARLHDRQQWHVRSLVPELFGVEDWALADLSTLPTLERQVFAHAELDIVRGIQPVIRPTWVLYRGLHPVAAFDETGGVHIDNYELRLREIYSNTGCDTYATAMHLAFAING